MGWLIGLLAPRVGEKFARPLAYALVAIGALALFFAGKALYDHAIIVRHDSAIEAKTAKADKKADNHAAEQRRVDDARLTAETTQLTEATHEAGDDPAAKRAAYYQCLQRIQTARRSRLAPPSCGPNLR